MHQHHDCASPSKVPQSGHHPSLSACQKASGVRRSADLSTTTDFGNSSRPASKTTSPTATCSKLWAHAGQVRRITVVSGSFFPPIRQMRRKLSEHLGQVGEGHAADFTEGWTFQSGSSSSLGSDAGTNLVTDRVCSSIPSSVNSSGKASLTNHPGRRLK